MNLFYRGVAIKMTESENHRTNTQYEASLVTKIIAFQIINSYSSLAYIAFIQDTQECEKGSCMGELGSAMMWIFLIQLLFEQYHRDGPTLVREQGPDLQTELRGPG